MVLSKRKRNDDFVVRNPPLPDQPQMSMSQQADPLPSVPPEVIPPTKKTRTNPPRSSKVATSELPAKTPKRPTVKKARASRAKQVSAPSQPATSAAVMPEAGPSQTATPPPKKRQKKAAPAADASGSEPEKRGAVFKSKCPQNILDRVERVMTQRIFMIDRNRVPGQLCEEFSVLGSTGNVYTVTIDHKPRCNCPDACRGNHCKHIVFIFLKVLQVAQTSGYWYQKALLTSELETIFAQAPLAPNSIAHAHIREAHARATGKAPAISVVEDAGSKNKRIPGPDDDCPICYDGMHGVAETLLVFCEECGNALHKECFQQWQRTAASNGKELTCVWCRAKWIVAAAGAGTGTIKRSMGAYGYLNLSGVADISPVRDTSTYYHGPRRGERYYGRQDYSDFA
ncbi:hypothetical protein BYT27DRAFT_7235662 [Phlegmacium glaucopus]|nr:hypothetical protein BYT27DRAFT_7235662 [Phlegmacium glaucopus]